MLHYPRDLMAQQRSVYVSFKSVNKSIVYLKGIWYNNSKPVYGTTGDIDMAYDNYLTSFKIHIKKHIQSFVQFSSTLGLTEAEVKAYVHKLTLESAIPIPEETYVWLAEFFKYVADKDALYVYDNTTGLWHFEDDDSTLRNVLTDYFTVIAQDAATAHDAIMTKYAQSFFSVNKIPNLTKRIRTAVHYKIHKSSDIIKETEKYRYFKTTDGRRALLDMTQETFNLRSTSFKDTQTLLLQHISPVPISVTDDTPTLWLSLLDTYMMGDPGKIAYFKKVLAYMMSPYNYNQVMIYFIGESGRNGKSTIIKVLQDILGPHAVRMNSDLLNSQPPSSFKKDDALAATEGRSLLIFNEIDERMVASTQNIKDLTEGGRDEFGNKVMTVVRPAYSRNYEVNVCGTPVVVANSLINFGDWSQLDPIFKRLILVPFDYKIVHEDPSLLNRLAAEYPKIQAWLYMNYFEHKNVNLKTEPKPQSIADKFKQYRADSDIIHLFWTDSVNVTNKTVDEILRSDLYRMYEQYCHANGRKPIRNKGTNGFSNLIQPLLDKVHVVHKNGTYYIQGIKQTVYFEKEIALK